MKTKIVIRIAVIGIFHAVLYLYIVPFIIYPKFGDNGMLFTGIVAVSVSVAVFGTAFIGKKFKGDKGDE